ncbi:hypothetical protein [Paucibacter sp. KCTC 42545]|uniref:hypothetical protein n=1 Tax=Paucibacter sp. KCTC 42545 TaxID=1768242 RepID=UPI000733AEB0|nr:hypothetical protein [Paucibacter sp. KCTC 42545]ALT79033.1 hypothetical protein AT984_19430 [Paucibacter sp. KCTC 42545]
MLPSPEDLNLNAHHAALRAPALLAALLALLTGCATAPDAIPGKRHSTQELLSYQPADFRWQPTRASAEEAARERDLSLLRQRLSLAPGSAEAQAALPDILAAVLHYNTEIDAARAPALSGLAGLEARPADVQRAVLSAVYRFYAPEASAQLWALLPKLSSPREFAIAANALLKPLTGPARQSAAAQIKAQMQLSFPTTWTDEPRLRALSWPLDQALQPSAPNAAPPLAELLAAPLRPGYPVVFSLQRPGREVLGLALLRGADGRFVREADGRLFQVPQLARALSNLPGTITLGNTPQGIFAVRGSSTASNPSIGPTPFLETKLPIEASVSEFFQVDGSDLDWSEPLYAALLPQSWQAWEPIKEAWLAGRAGRDEILMHGSVVNPDYYRGASYYPATPTAGCLTAPEQWDPANGRLLASGQLQLAQAFARAYRQAQERNPGGLDPMVKGYLVMVELPGNDGAGGPVLAAELEASVQAAEQRWLNRPR